jgi:hypothetical protein
MTGPAGRPQELEGGRDRWRIAVPLEGGRVAGILQVLHKDGRTPRIVHEIAD